jgi:hypothetical protein
VYAPDDRGALYMLYALGSTFFSSRPNGDL